MATIKKYKLKNGKIKYLVKGYAGIDEKTGKQINFKKSGFNSKKEAETFFHKLQVKIDNGNYRKQNNNIKTFNDLYTMWLENDYKQGNRKDSTVALTERNFKLHILPIFGNMKIKKITANDVYQAVKKWTNEKLAKTNVFKNFVSSVLQFGVINGYLNRNVASGIQVPRHDHKINRDTIANYYDGKELNVFLKYVKEDWKSNQPYVFFCLLAYTGIRKGEAFALTWQDIDFKNNMIDINKTVSKVNNKLVVQAPKTVGSKRKIKVATPLIKLLKQWQAEQNKNKLIYGIRSDLLFTNRKGGLIQPTKATYWLDRTQKKHGLKHVTAHGFRHTFATLSFANGTDIKTVSKYLGHSNIQTTMDIYTAVTKEQETDASEKMAKIINLD